MDITKLILSFLNKSFSVKYFIAIALTLICFNAQVFSQTTPAIQWQKTFGGTSDDIAQSIQETKDGGYIVAGYTYSYDGDVTGNHGSYDYWIVKLDAYGNRIWQKTLGGSADDKANSIRQTTDGGYIVAGSTSSSDGDVTGNHSPGFNDCWIVKLDANGYILWQKTLGGFADDKANSIRQTTDGGYIVAGSTSSFDAGINSDYLIAKLDASGNILWQKTLGGSADDKANSVRQTIDGSYIIAGTTSSNDRDVTGNYGNSDYWIVKLDANGNMIWQKTLGGSSSDEANSIQQTKNGNYIVAGSTYSNDGKVTGNHGNSDYWIWKLDPTDLDDTTGPGDDPDAQKTFGGSLGDEANSIQQTVDSGYIVAGYANSNDGDIIGNHGGSDYWIMKLNANVNMVWQKTFGGTSNESANSIQQTTDGGYIVAGSTNSHDGDVTGNHGGYDYWIVKLTDTCTSVTPVISIVANPGTSVCIGSKVIFTGTVTNGGTTPVYQWKKNGINIGTHTKTYIDSTLKNGDSIYCVLTSNAACATTSTAKSNVIKMTVSTPVTPTISIAVSAGTSVCTGYSTVFIATITNGGTSPIYQWKKNGINVGTNSKTYIVDTALKNGDSIYCQLTSNYACATTSTVKSNGVKMIVNKSVTPTINIVASPGTNICSGTKVTFTATITNGGTSPLYEWYKVNSKGWLKVGTNSNTYIVDTALKSGDSIYCLLTSNAVCASSIGRSYIVMTVNSPVTPTVTITASPGTGVCTRSKVTFTATITNGGTAPFYQWKKNGVNVGINSNTYVIDTALKNGDSIYCILTSNAICVTTSTAKSNGIKMTVKKPVAPTVSITANTAQNICAGSTVIFTATISNGGNKPIYQWKKNGVNVGTNSNTYVDIALKNGDSIYCALASNASCVTMSIVNSNGIKMTVSKPVTPTVSIAVSPEISVCTGSKITFTATATNGGTTPVYQWKKNGIIVGTNSNTYIVDTALKNGDSIYCVFTSNAICATTSTAKSNVIKMTVNKTVTPTISIAANPSTSVCAGSKVTFTAIITNGGTSPVYQWKKNGINLGTNSKTYIVDTALKNSDSIYCVLTSKAVCATTSTVKSNGIKMIVNTCLLAGNNNQSSVKSQSKELLLFATPNPFKNSVQLTVTSPFSEKATILITAMTGQKVFKKDMLLNPGSNVISVASSGWSAGIYYVQVGTDSETKSCKIIKE